jgi:DNA primase
MRYPSSILDDIRARLPVSAVVGRRVKLAKAGREWKGLSPFNAEKSPSFFVNDQKGFYHDFSSGKHGDIFTFVMETEGLSFGEAVERLAADAGVQLPKLSAEAVRQEERSKGLTEVMALAAAYFESVLKGPSGGKARSYLEGRGLTREIWAEFGLGYATGERFALRDHLAGKGVSSEQMIEAGLLIHGEDIAVPYDRFRDRVMFPIHDVRGRVIAFGGRAMAKDAQAKYLNSPDTPLFLKGRVLYNHHRARKAAHDRGTVIAVEGYVDVIAMSRAGFGHTVAPLGTALTEEQLGLMWRMADEPILCFDGDKAGRRAAYRAIDVALPRLEAGKSLRFALLPEGQDPDDLFREGGAGAIETVIGRAMPLVDMVWSRALEAGPVDTPERRAAFERRLKEGLQSIPDENLRRYYREDMERRIAAMFAVARPGRPAPGAPQRGGGRGAARWQKPVEGASIREAIAPSEHLVRSSIFMKTGTVSAREALILAGLLHDPAALPRFSEDLARLNFGHADTRALVRAMLDYFARAEAGEVPLEAEAMAGELERRGLGKALRAVEQALRPGDRLMLVKGEDKKIDLDTLLKQAFILHRRALTLNTELRAAERAFAEEASEANFTLLVDLKEQLSALEGTEAEIEPEYGSDRD